MKLFKNIACAFALITSSYIVGSTFSKLDYEMLAYIHATIKDGIKDSAEAKVKILKNSSVYTHTVGQEDVTVYVFPATPKNKQMIKAHIQGICFDSNFPMEEELEKLKARQLNKLVRKDGWFSSWDEVETVESLKTDHTACYNNYDYSKTIDTKNLEWKNKPRRLTCFFEAELDPATARVIDERDKKLLNVLSAYTKISYEPEEMRELALLG